MKLSLSKIFITGLVFVIMSCSKDSDAQEIEKGLNTEIAQKILEKTNGLRHQINCFTY